MFDSDDISADVGAAIKSLNDGDAAPAPASVEPALAAEAEGGPARDEQGRFAPKGAEEATAAKPTEPNATPEGEQAEPQAPKPETIRPPASWSASAKAEFSKLPPLIQQEVLKRESDIERGKTEFQDRATRLNRFEAVLEPYRTEIQLAGVDEATYVSRLFAAEKVLRENPDYGFRYLAQLYGYDLNRLAGQPQPGTAPQAPVHPQFQGLQSEVQTLKQQLEARQQAEEQQKLDAAKAEVAAFAKENVYFENVKGHVAALLESGQAKSLQDAYDQAVWASPETRALMLADQQRKADADATEARRKAAEQAKRAGGSVAGSSAGAPAPSNDPNSSIEDDVRAALRAAAGRA